MSAPIYTGGRPFTKGGFRMKNFVSFNKTITGIADDVATTIFTINIPNPASGTYVTALLNVSLVTILGAGGGVAPGETATAATGSIVVTRTPGAAAVIGISSLTQTTSCAVSGGSSSVAATLTNVAVAGGNSATQTFAIQTTIDDDTNSATNDICVVFVEALMSGTPISFT